MRICICTTPIRSTPTDFPPLGSMAIIQSLQGAGYEVDFYNIDYHRPSEAQLRTYFAEQQYAVLGISAVVSTAYDFTKSLAAIVRQVSPKTQIVVGGNLAASAEVILRQCEVDVCVAGDGELIIRDLVRVLERDAWTTDDLLAVPGLCLLDEDGEFRLTGYAEPLGAEEIEWPDYRILERDGSLEMYIQPEPTWLAHYGLKIPSHLRGKRSATLITTKGCVARCTFCHRWERGYRMRPLEQIIEHVESLRDRYDVGFLDIADENFGSNKNLTRELVERLGEMGFVWTAHGVRARTVDKETLAHWAANGCRSIFFGIESGSQQMLDVMEKNTSVKMNINAVRWTHEAGLFTILQFVIGMPGESDTTVRETAEFLRQCEPYLQADGRLPGALLSINYAQALPGTPLYEYARQRGFIGGQLDDEEDYLTRISNIDASDFDHFINYGEHPLLKVKTWRPWLIHELNAAHIQRRYGVALSLPGVAWHLLKRSIQHAFGGGTMTSDGARSPLDQILSLNSEGYHEAGDYFNFRRVPLLPIFSNPLTGRLSYAALAGAVAVKTAGRPWTLAALLLRHVVWSIRKRFSSTELPSKSLREIVAEGIPPDDSASNEMIPLRLGR